ncbi:hypothetical protein IAU60_006468 [Kwoniella sp. DSM 27419]
MSTSSPLPLPQPPAITPARIEGDAQGSLSSRPTLHFPTLHLGSFDTLTKPFTTSPTSSRHTLDSGGSSPTRASFVGGTRDDTQSAEVNSDKAGRDATRLAADPSRSSSHSTRSSHQRASVPPPSLPPPTMALPPLPNISPISPIGAIAPTPVGSDRGVQSTLFQTSSTSSSSSSIAQLQNLNLGPRELPNVSGRGRALGHSLTIHIPGPLTPSSEREHNPLHSPVIRNSPGVARRRTVIETPGNHHASPVKLSGAYHGSLTPPRDTSPTPERPSRSSPVLRGSIVMPTAKPTPALEQNATLDSPRRLEKKRSSNDLRNASPIASPTTKRSLPRPPKLDHASSDKPSMPELSQPVLSSARTQTTTDVATAAHSKHTGAQTRSADVPQRSGPPGDLPPPQTAPVPSTSWPPLNITRSPQARPQPLVTPTEALPKPSMYQRHQANKSASSLPIVAGLADAGPYSGAAMSKPLAANGPSGLGLGRPGGPGQQAQNRGPSGKPAEEVCLECMMRDRDLADVHVQGEGVWERASDADWRDYEWREQALLKSMGNVNHEASSARIADDSSEDSDETSVSPPSTGNSGEDARLRQRIMEKKHRRSMVQAKKREVDWRVVREVGWRGFKWEEGEAGEGLPRGFRGGRGGPLSEEAIKAVMTKFPSASAHRYQTLQTYLRQQWLLVLDVRAEAQRLGRFPFPDDLVTSSSTISSHEGHIPRAGQPGSSGMYGQPGGVSTPVRQTPALSVVRPSPSSPANLTAMAGGPVRAPPQQRPMTHFLPDREPSGSSARSPMYSSPIPVAVRPRQDTHMSSPGALGQSPRPSGTYEGSDEELWQPEDAPGGNLRPFSFAVRAGATARGAGASDGHGGRRSLWGRFGGSVTSLFGGSQNGSGSMMDMHLGLDSDRRNRSSSVNVNPYPRAVSLASPTRPSFFSRDSRCSSVIEADQPRVSRVISQSRLSQMRLDDDESDEAQNAKKKGIKGFFNKLKSKGAKNKKSEPAFKVEHEPRAESETPLAPPPPMSHLVGHRKTNRDRSGTSSTMQTDGTDTVAGKRYSASLPYGMRSVSAPMNGTGSSSGGSLSASPTSSKFATSGPKRDSYASARRQSFTLNGLGDEYQPEKRRSIGPEAPVNGARDRPAYSPEQTTFYDEPGRMHRPAQNNGYANPAFRPHNKTTSSLSNSSGTMGIETPPPAVYSSGSFFNQQVQASNLPQQSQPVQPQVRTKPATVTSLPSGQLSPNRFKNLPPIPPGQEKSIGFTSSPDSFAAAFPDQGDDLNLAGTVHDPRYLDERYQQNHQGRPSDSMRGYPLQGNGYAQAQGYPSAHARAMASGRASFDQLTPRGRGQINDRNVKTMYGQPSVSDLGVIGTNGRPGEIGYPTVTGEKKKKGFKGFFGGSKAGRMA